jgi:hypothetical protein
VGTPVPAGGLTRDLLKLFQVGANLRYARQVIGTQAADPQARVRRPGAGRPATIMPAERKRLYDRFKELVAEKHPTPAKQLALENPGVSRTALRQRLSRWNKIAPVSQPLAESQPERKKPRKKRGL